MTTRCAIWARVSSTDGSQTNQNQLDVLREWAARRDLEVAREFVTEDSAWATARNGNGSSGFVEHVKGTRSGKGGEFDKARTELLRGAQRGDYGVVLIWSLDRLSRRGIKDLLGILDDLWAHGAEVWSDREPWLATTDPHLRSLIVSIFAWLAEMESTRRSERIRAGMARRKREGLSVGGRKKGSKDRRRRSGEGYKAAWGTLEHPGPLRIARDRTVAERRAGIRPDPVKAAWGTVEDPGPRRIKHDEEVALRQAQVALVQAGINHDLTPEEATRVNDLLEQGYSATRIRRELGEEQEEQG